MKYTIVRISGIITQIAKEVKLEKSLKGVKYTEGVIECFLPDESTMTEEQCNAWIAENNKRMEAICKFLNDKNL